MIDLSLIDKDDVNFTVFLNIDCLFCWYIFSLPSMPHLHPFYFTNFYFQTCFLFRIIFLCFSQYFTVSLNENQNQKLSPKLMFVINNKRLQFQIYALLYKFCVNQTFEKLFVWFKSGFLLLQAVYLFRFSWSKFECCENRFDIISLVNALISF